VIKQFLGGDPLGVALEIPVKRWNVLAQPVKFVDHQELPWILKRRNGAWSQMLVFSFSCSLDQQDGSYINDCHTAMASDTKSEIR